MLNCIIATTRPNSGMKRPSTPASFMRRNVDFRAHVARQQLEEDAVRLGVVAQLVVDQPVRAPELADGIGMQERVRVLGLREEADEVHGIALEDVGVRDVDAAVVDAEIGPLADLAPASATTAD